MAWSRASLQDKRGKLMRCSCDYSAEESRLSRA